MKLITIRLTEAEVASLPDPWMTLPNRVRLALGLEPLQHGGKRLSEAFALWKARVLELEQGEKRKPSKKGKGKR